jgi:acyl-CoA reductase-like NAD-dependent aldehyde dehydrogenase
MTIPRHDDAKQRLDAIRRELREFDAAKDLSPSERNSWLSRLADELAEVQKILRGTTTLPPDE